MTTPFTIPHDADTIANAITKVVNTQSTGTLADNANLANNTVIKSYVDAVQADLQGDIDGITKTVNGTTTTKAVVFTKSFESTDQDLPGADVTLQVAHGLGAVPFMFQAYYKCFVDNNGYIEGELVSINTINANHNANHQVNFFADDTNIGLRNISNSHYVADKDGTSYLNISDISSSWRVVFRAFL